MTHNNTVDYSHITTILFDMDGTLIEHTWPLSQITETLFARFSNELVSVSHDEFFDLFWSKNEDMWYMMVDGVLAGDIAAKYSYVNTLRALGQNTALAEPMLNYWQQLVLEETVPFEDVFSVLGALRGKFSTGIVTNGFSILQQKKLDHHKLAEFVDFTLVSEEAGYHKPDKRLFLKALQLAGNPSPHQTLYVGDNPTTDIQGAQAAGLIPIFKYSQNDFEIPTDVVKIKQLKELLVLLKLC